jgi:hypothetical protein
MCVYEDVRLCAHTPDVWNLKLMQQSSVRHMKSLQHSERDMRTLKVIHGVGSCQNAWLTKSLWPGSQRPLTDPKNLWRINSTLPRRWKLRSPGSLHSEQWQFLTTTCSVITHKGAVIIYFMVKAWNHAYFMQRRSAWSLFYAVWWQLSKSGSHALCADFIMPGWRTVIRLIHPSRSSFFCSLK